MYAQSCCTSSLTEGIDVLWFMIKMRHEGTQADFWGACRQVGRCLDFERDHGTNPHGTPVCDGYASEESLKQGASGRWTSEQEWAHEGPAQHVVPAGATATLWQLELGRTVVTGRRGLLAAGRSTRQGGAAAEAGGAVTTKSCACGRAARYAATQELNITQCFLSLRKFLIKKKKKPNQSLMYLVFFPSLKMPRLF